MVDQDILDAFAQLEQGAKNNYVQFSDDLNRRLNTPDYKQDDYALGLQEGKKFIRIVYRGGAFGFIVKEDGPKWKRGDMLKSASWKSPAQNFKRGNIFDPESFKNIRWTGIA